MVAEVLARFDRVAGVQPGPDAGVDDLVLEVWTFLNAAESAALPG